MVNSSNYYDILQLSHNNTIMNNFYNNYNNRNYSLNAPINLNNNINMNNANNINNFNSYSQKFEMDKLAKNNLVSYNNIPSQLPFSFKSVTQTDSFEEEESEESDN